MKNVIRRMILTGLLAGAALLPLAAQSSDMPRLAVFGFINQTGDDAFTIPSDTASGNLLITMKALNKFQVSSPDTIPRSLTDEGLEQWCARNSVDFVLFGTLTKTPSETQDYQLAYFSHSAKKIITRETETGDSVNDVFSITDELVDSVIGSMVKTKVTFGSVSFANSGVDGDYDVYLNDIFIQTSPTKFERVPAGSHAVRVVQKDTGKEVFASTVTVASGKTVSVKFALKTATTEEKAAAAQASNPGNNDYSLGYQEGLASAPKRSAPYFFAGCCLGPIGIIIPAVATPTVPQEALVGKSAEYINGYQVGFKARAKSNNMKSAGFGALVTTACGCISYYLLIIVAAASVGA